MTKQKVGAVLFIIAAVWAVAWGLLVSLSVNAAYHMTADEVNQTMWAMNGSWVPVC